jgi:hypothetical protein
MLIAHYRPVRWKCKSRLVYVFNETDLSTSNGPLVEDRGLVAVFKCQYMRSLSCPLSL